MDVHKFLEDVFDSLIKDFDRCSKIRYRSNLTLDQRAALHSLRHHIDIVITESDKNLGVVAMNASNYECLGLRMFAQSHVEVQSSESDIIDPVRNHLRRVYNSHN
eukprot:SAG11_NODE_5423_length_1564_cov_1.868942_2_plen_105_part_00